MSIPRKVKKEMDQTFKKIAEGMDIFDDYWNKIYESNADQSQQIKYAQDLKKELKKLQRCRDQVKSWIANSSYKIDKSKLIEARREIEKKMEMFKECEREVKTKAFSKEGLKAAAEREANSGDGADVDDMTKDTIEWVSDFVEQLEGQIEEGEEEMSNIRGKGRRKEEKKEEIENRLEKHRWHVEQLEDILEHLRCGNLDNMEVEEIRDDLEYYVDSNQDPDFFPNEDVYEEIDLEDVDAMKERNDKKKRKLREEKQKAEEKRRKSEEKKAKKKKKTEDAGKKASVVTTTAALPLQQREKDSPVTSSKSANSGGGKTPSKGSKKVAGVADDEPDIKGLSSSVSSSRGKEEDGNKRKQQEEREEQQWRLQQERTTTEVAAEDEKRKELQRRQQLLQRQQMQQNLQRKMGEKKEGRLPPPVAKNDDDAWTAQGEKRVENVIGAFLGRTPSGQDRAAATNQAVRAIMASASRKSTRDESFFMPMEELEISMRHAPRSSDSERPVPYVPLNPAPGLNEHFPTQRLASLDNVPLFSKFDTDALFFIFYHQPGTYHQYLAAKELKRQSWRFHKKYRTWFQRHEEPKLTTDEYEQGTYVYFDYETGWYQRIKSEFTFEYSFLEDSLTA